MPRGSKGSPASGAGRLTVGDTGRPYGTLLMNRRFEYCISSPQHEPDRGFLDRSLSSKPLESALEITDIARRYIGPRSDQLRDPGSRFL